MLRYYMKPETREALIAESNRLIAARAATHARHGPLPGHGDASNEETVLRDDDHASADNDSVFARLVSDLQSVARAA